MCQAKIRIIIKYFAYQGIAVLPRIDENREDKIMFVLRYYLHFFSSCRNCRL